MSLSGCQPLTLDVNWFTTERFPNKNRIFSGIVQITPHKVDLAAHNSWSWTKKKHKNLASREERAQNPRMWDKKTQNLTGWEIPYVAAAENVPSFENLLHIQKNSRRTWLYLKSLICRRSTILVLWMKKPEDLTSMCLFCLSAPSPNVIKVIIKIASSSSSSSSSSSPLRLSSWLSS